MENKENIDKISQEKPKQKSKFLKFLIELFSWIKAIAIAFILSFLVTKFVIINAKVPTPSMVNTINVGDRFIGNRFQYIFKDPERYDIVVFKYPDDNKTLFVKRVIGLPGETVEIIDGKVYINGSQEPLRDDFLPEPMAKEDYGPYEVPEGHYFMLGDNRNYSEDSRFWKNKYVNKNQILGKAIFKYYPKFENLTKK